MAFRFQNAFSSFRVAFKFNSSVRFYSNKPEHGKSYVRMPYLKHYSINNQYEDLNRIVEQLKLHGNFTSHSLGQFLYKIALPRFALTNDERAKLADNILSIAKDKGLPLNNDLFINYMANCIQTNRDIDVIAYLKEIEDNKTTPNSESLLFALRYYCSRGEMTSASEILGKFNEYSIAVDELVFSQVLAGYIRAGDSAEAQATLELMNERKIPITVTTHRASYLAFSRVGNVSGMLATLESSQWTIPFNVITQGYILAVGVGCDQPQALKIVQQAVDTHPDSNIQSAWPQIVQAIKEGNLDAAKSLLGCFSSYSSDGTVLKETLIALFNAEVPMDTIKEFHSTEVFKKFISHYKNAKDLIDAASTKFEYILGLVNLLKFREDSSIQYVFETIYKKYNAEDGIYKFLSDYSMNESSNTFSIGTVATTFLLNKEIPIETIRENISKLEQNQIYFNAIAVGCMIHLATKGDVVGAKEVLLKYVDHFTWSWRPFNNARRIKTTLFDHGVTPATVVEFMIALEPKSPNNFLLCGLKASIMTEKPDTVNEYLKEMASKISPPGFKYPKDLSIVLDDLKRKKIDPENYEFLTKLMSETTGRYFHPTDLKQLSYAILKNDSEEVNKILDIAREAKFFDALLIAASMKVQEKDLVGGKAFLTEYHALKIPYTPRTIQIAKLFLQQGEVEEASKLLKNVLEFGLKGETEASNQQQLQVNLILKTILTGPRPYSELEFLIWQLHSLGVIGAYEITILAMHHVKMRDSEHLVSLLETALEKKIPKLWSVIRNTKIKSFLENIHETNLIHSINASDPAKTNDLENKFRYKGQLFFEKSDLVTLCSAIQQGNTEQEESLLKKALNSRFGYPFLVAANLHASSDEDLSVASNLLETFENLRPTHYTYPNTIIQVAEHFGRKLGLQATLQILRKCTDFTADTTRSRQLSINSLLRWMSETHKEDTDEFFEILDELHRLQVMKSTVIHFMAGVMCAKKDGRLLAKLITWATDKGIDRLSSVVRRVDVSELLVEIGHEFLIDSFEEQDAVLEQTNSEIIQGKSNKIEDVTAQDIIKKLWDVNRVFNHIKDLKVLGKLNAIDKIIFGLAMEGNSKYLSMILNYLDEEHRSRQEPFLWIANITNGNSISENWNNLMVNSDRTSRCITLSSWPFLLRHLPADLLKLAPDLYAQLDQNRSDLKTLHDHMIRALICEGLFNEAGQHWTEHNTMELPILERSDFTWLTNCITFLEQRKPEMINRYVEKCLTQAIKRATVEVIPEILTLSEPAGFHLSLCSAETLCSLHEFITFSLPSQNKRVVKILEDIQLIWDCNAEDQRKVNQPRTSQLD